MMIHFLWIYYCLHMIKNLFILKDIEPDYKRNEFILNYLQTRPDKDFAAFCTALKLFDQKHVIDEYLQEENVSSAVQESTSAPVTPVSHLEHGGDRNCEPAPQEESFQNENSQTENLQTPQEDAFVHLGGIGDGDRGSGLTAAIQCASERETGVFIFQFNMSLDTMARLLVCS